MIYQRQRRLTHEEKETYHCGNAGNSAGIRTIHGRMRRGRTPTKRLKNGKKWCLAPLWGIGC